MTRERWGTFSVIDHINASAFVPEILLYDRLVIPVPCSDEDRVRWTNNGWKPDLLEERLETLGDIAIEARWDEELQKMFNARMGAVKYDVAQTVNAVREALPYQVTRMILAEKPIHLPEGVAHAVVVAAYQSEHDFKGDFLLKDASDEGAQLGLLLGQKIAIPDIDGDDKEVLLRVKDLATSEDFKRKRRKLYEWQEDILGKRIVPDTAIGEMNKLVDEYNDCVQKATKKVYFNFAFTLGAVALGITGAALGSPLALGSAFMAITKFALLDRKAEVKATDECKPAAMFHDVKKTLGWDIV
jgi:hypothetical protein